MFKKVYERLKQFIIENYLFITFLVLFVAIMDFQVPYYIYSGGGIINVNKKIDFNGKTESNGSYNICYVEEYKGNVLLYLLSYIMPDWEREKEDNVLLDNETDKDLVIRDKIYLETGNNSALITAFNYANKELEILDNKVTILYVSELAKTNLNVGDQILSIDDKKIKNANDIDKVINNKNINDKINIKVKNARNKILEKYAYIINYENKKKIGISITNKQTIKTNPKINFNFKKNEYGPSGGLILSLALYDYLVDEDITKGLKISGTGTIDDNGSVGEIGGVKHKLTGAVKKKADIFFVPNGSNYKEAIKLKKEKKYDIEVVGVDTFEDALNYLKEKKV